jgi:hypothetical protein
MATAEVQEIRANSYVGFDSITSQIEHKLLKRGFQFNVIVVGMSCSPLSPSWPSNSAALYENLISNLTHSDY